MKRAMESSDRCMALSPVRLGSSHYQGDGRLLQWTCVERLVAICPFFFHNSAFDRSIAGLVRGECHVRIVTTAHRTVSHWFTLGPAGDSWAPYEPSKWRPCVGHSQLFTRGP